MPRWAGPRAIRRHRQPSARNMRAPAIGTGRAVEVLHDRGPARPTGGDRWTGGSGYLIRSGLVLTAAHNVDYRRDLRDDEQLLVRTIEGDLLPARVLLIGDEPSWADLALLELSDSRFGEHLPPVTFARVDRDNPAPVWGAGRWDFPGSARPVLSCRGTAAGRPGWYSVTFSTTFTMSYRGESGEQCCPWR